MNNIFEVKCRKFDGKDGLGLSFDELVEKLNNSSFAEDLAPEIWGLRGRDPFLLDSVDSEVTLAHIAALYNRLPASFSLWGLVDDNGWTVAHAAAAMGVLPDDFQDWSFADKDGTTVAPMLST